MKTVDQLALATTCLALLALSGPAIAGGSTTTDLVAGQHEVVGTVTVEDDGTEVTVTYDIESDNVFISEWHLYVDGDKPKKHSPGRFPYGEEGTFDTSVSQTVALSDLGLSGGDSVYVAAHAVVEFVEEWGAPDFEQFELDLPEQVTITSQHAGGNDSYWDITVTGGGDLDGTYDGWCVDTDRSMSSGTSYTADVISSSDPDLDETYVEYFENFDQVNWIINQDYVGSASPSGGTYTYGDVQKAIWTLVEDNNSSGGLGSWSQTRVDEILADSAAYGVGFESACEERIAVLLVPTNGSTTTAQIIIAQVTVIEVGIPCEPLVSSDETAWGDGDLSFKQSWASYLEYETCE
jgi:hypothetical protein